MAAAFGLLFHLLAIVVSFVLLPLYTTATTSRPRVRCVEGHLRLEGGANRNISLSTQGSGAVVVNGVDVAGSLRLVSAVRPQLEGLHNTDLGYLVRNLSTVASTVASHTWILTSVTSLNTSVTRNTANVRSLQNNVLSLRTSLDPLVVNVSRLSNQVSLITPESSRSRLQQVDTLLTSLQQTTTQVQQGLHEVTSQSLPNVEQGLAGLRVEVNSLPELRNRLQALERRLNTSAATSSTPSINITSANYIAALTTLQREVYQLKSQLQVDECASGPCRNGGTCIDGYLRFTCLCPKAWQGGDCSLDVDECVQYMGTDLGCQNGATCVNIPGSFRCLCPPGKFGVRCDQQSNSCTASSGSALCGGHGTCVSSSGQHGYTCICDEGWKSQNQANGPVCVDVDECGSQTPHCSRSPAVQCINYPGGFTCGPCPQGFSGNGFVCNDVDECQINNGGCSPFSQCYNTYGGHRCGPCAAGYTGDGTICTPSLRPCQMAQCHPLATCYENPQMSSTYYQCVCPQGYQGSGMGPHGCTPIPGTGSTGAQGISINWCNSQPCLNGGTCTQSAYTYTCSCTSGYTGQNCEVDIDECSSNPCLNGGTCTQGLNSFSCSCSSSHTGDRCQTENQQCGGRLMGTEGVVAFPGVGFSLYNHNVSCAWVIWVPRGQVINITFSNFHLEGGSCRFDWLQIHDGQSNQDPIHGRYCGTSLPGDNGTILTTHNVVYMWFRSDHSVAGYGFNFTWNATEPVCGGDLHGQEYGSFKSPGYPGHYPTDRDCYWTITVSPGKRIKFHFPTLQLEHHDNCSFDFLEIRDGLTENGHSLGRYCSSLTPEPLTTSGSEAFVHFHSDVSLSDTGFLISYSAEPGIPGCGGLLTGDRGEFSAPTVSDSYEHNLHCEWVIRVPPGEIIELNFTEFHLEHHHACRYDYVEVRNGGSADSPLIRRACGTDLPNQIVSTGRQLYVLFHSDFSLAYRGFRAMYQVACGGEFTGDTGLIRSPYNPQPYPGNRECIYLINQPVGKAILLNFTFFDIEGSGYWGCVYDYVELRDGRRPTAPLLGRYCGPESRRPDPILSTHNYMWIKFRTDSSIHNLGFVANYTTIDTTCGGVLTALTGVINSPNSPDTYPTGTDCQWVIDLPLGYVIQLTWHSFSLEHHRDCQFDYVEVFDNSSVPGQGGRMGSRFCGSTTPPIMTSTDNLVTIHFHSDESVNHDGFSAVYHGLDASRACGGHYHTETGILTSPNYPDYYPRSRSCEWTITAHRGHQIHLTFLDMEVEPDSHCSFDALEIRNGGFSTSPLLTTVCGVNVTVPEVYSHSHQLYLKFTSDYSVSFKGFKLQWDSTTTGCGGLLTGETGGISSPGYPQPYNHPSDCYWTIRVSQGSSIQLHFTDMDVVESYLCYFSSVEVRDGSSEDASLLGRYCSQGQGLIALNSTSNTLWIRYKTYGGTSGRGFKAIYSTNCNRVLKGPRGVITTPNFPDPYPHYRNCTWVIEAPRGNSINASFSDFVLEDHMDEETGECLFDYVEVREAVGRQGSRTRIGHYCQRPPPPIATSPRNNILEVNFISDMSVALNGFRLEWIINGCGGELTKPYGTFSSPGYPNAYPRETLCEWYIKTAPGTRIEITIHEMDIESASNCVFDVLNVYGGSDSNSPLLTSLCHHQTHPITVFSQGNHAFVSFNSDQSVRGKGFNISYSTHHDGCGGLFTAPEGTIHTPNYPDNDYNNESDCTWTIKVDALHVVELNFTDFEVQSTAADCGDGFVMIYDGENLNAPLLLQHCGSSLPPLLRSTGCSLTLRLKADGRAPSKGFSANYKRGCGATISVDMNGSGQLVSPNYPSLYTSGLNCSWHLSAPEGSRIHLHIVHLDMHMSYQSNDNCSYDYVSILDGALLDSPQRGRYCGSSSPRPLISNANHLTVHLVSSQGVFVGFRATYSIFTSTCGGALTSASGELASPLYPDPYPVNSECVWTVVAGPGNRIQLNFIEFDVEESDGCNQDYVEVHETSAAGSLLLHNCSSSTGSTLPPSVTVHNTLWIKFRTDGVSSGGRGFLASYSIMFGSELYGTDGEVVSPLYPQRYMGYQDVSWTITVPWGQYVSITFLDLDVEGDPVEGECFSSIVVYNGGSSQYSPVLGTFCGHQVPTEPIVSRRRRVLVKLNANHLHKGSRFRFRYEAVDTRGEVGTLEIESDSNCTYLVTVNTTYSTSLHHPGFPERPANNLNCEWVLQAPLHERIRIRLYYDLEESSTCVYDRIIVYDGLGGDRNWNKTATLCRRNQLPYQFISSGHFLKIRFLTDSSIQSLHFFISARAVCGGTLNQPEGSISSPNYPNNYPPGQSCEWVLRVGIGRTIRLEFSELKIANSTATCGGDYLVIQNGGHPSSPFLEGGKYCGRSIPQPMESDSNAIRLKFVTDNIDADKGFKLIYHEMSDACGGSHRLTQDITSYTLTSPNYPNSPDPHTECSWLVYAPPEKSLSLHFEGHFEIPSYFGSCDQAFVEIRDGGTILSPLLGKFCGSTLPSTQHTSGDVLYIRYFNNVTQHHTGFKAKASTDVCGGTYNVMESRIITTPGYPSPYAANLNCTWTIVAPLGHYLTASFLQVEISSPDNNCTSNSGLLTIRNQNATGEVLKSVCGSPEEVMPIHTPSNKAYITFTAGTNDGKRGFRIVLNSSEEVCGGEVSGPEGEIRSPGYPHGYASWRQCEWTIIAPAGKRVKLEFIDFDMQNRGPGGRRTSRCRDNVKIFNGVGELRRHMVTICNALTSSTYNSSQNLMTVRFKTLGQSNARGFRAQWTSEDPQVCGGDLDVSGGELSVPATENSTVLTHYCTWTLNNPSPANSSFVVSFSLFENFDYCSDAILIEGVDSEGQPVRMKLLCEITTPPLIVVPYHTLKITFIKSWFHGLQTPNWTLSYSINLCGGRLHGPQNVITSPNFPSNYPNNVHCSWLFHYSEGEQIDFQFTNFDLENAIHHDYVTVQNGPLMSSPLLGRYTGNENPGSVGRSMSNNLLVEFHTDDSTTRQGFRAVTARHTRACGGNFHGHQGNFSSVGFPSDYEPNTECEWMIHTPAGYHAVITFTTQFDIETSSGCLNDYVEVYHAEQSEAHGPIQWLSDSKMCGKQLPQPITSSGSKVKLLFHANEAVQGSGFQASWQMLCGNNFTQMSGYVVSPGHPNNYPAFADCEYRIVADPEAFVSIQFISFDVERGWQCNYDFLTVREENIIPGWRWRRRRRRSWGPYCGRDLPGNFTTRGTTVISFHSDYVIERPGFVAKYTIKACGGTLNEPGEVSLPTNPGYHNHMMCVWNITAPEGKVPHIKFQRLILESHRQCRFDSVSVYEGHSPTQENLVARFCGDHTDDLPVVTTQGNTAQLVFKSDHSVTREGFWASLEFTYACGGNVNISAVDASHTIRSFSLSNSVNYEPLLQCTWLVEGLEDQVVTLTFTRLQLEPPGVNDTEPCPRDRVEIYDGPSTKSTLISVHCNSTSLPAPISSSTNVMFIRFISDSTNQFPGFTATLTNTPHPCGASSLHATNETQVLQSPEYPNQYPTNTRCRWIIAAPEEDDTVHLEINDMNLEASPHCTKDKLFISEYTPLEPLIHSGSRRSYSINIGGTRASFFYGFRLNHGYCGTTIPHHLTSLSNAVELRFISDASTVSSGFRLHYSIGGCNRTFNGTTGTVKTNGSPSCRTTFVAPEGSYINLYFSTSYISTRGSNCTTGNSLKVYDGTQSSSPLLLSTCGYRVANPVFSSGNALYLEFARERNGHFKLTYTTSNKPGGCGGSMHITSNSRLTSPGYPGPVATNLDCLFTLTVQPDQHVVINFRTVDFSGAGGCNSTYLELYDVDPSGQSTLFNTLCGDDGLIAPYLSPNSMMALRYVTGPTNITGQGWVAFISQAKPHEPIVLDEEE